MKRHLLFAICVIAAFVLNAADQTYHYSAAEKPAPAVGLDGKLLFNYKNNYVAALTASPDDNGSITITGDRMAFYLTGNGAYITNNTDGLLVFANSVTGSSLRCYASAPKNDFTYHGYANFLDNTWREILPNANLLEYSPCMVVMENDDGAGGKNPGMANPNNTMHVAACITNEETKVITFQYQTAAAKTAATNGSKSITSGEEYYIVKVIKMELRQNGTSIEARVATTNSYQVWSPLDNKLEHGFDIDELIAEQGLGDRIRTFTLYTTSRKSGYGCNTLRIQRDPLKINSAIRFDNEVSLAKGGSITVNGGLKLEISHLDLLPPSHQYWFSGGSIYLRNGSLNYTGSFSGGNDGSFYLLNDKVISSHPYSDQSENPDQYVNTSSVKFFSNHHIGDIIACTPYAPNASWPNDEGKGRTYDSSQSWAHMAGAAMGGAASDGLHPANLFNLKQTDQKFLWGQFQCQHGAILKCVYVKFTQAGGDIMLNVENRKTYSCVLTNANLVADFGPNLMGVDFDELITTAGTARYGVTKQYNAYTVSGSGYGIRDIHLNFSEPASYFFPMTAVSKSQNIGITVGGLPTSRMTLNLQEFRALTTNGTLTVKNGGTVILGGSYTLAKADSTRGMVGCTCPWYVEKGGILRQERSYVFGWKQPITLDGGVIKFDPLDMANKNPDTDDLITYFTCVTMRNGANLTTKWGDLPVRVGGMAQPNYSTWTIDGVSPSTNNVSVKLLAGDSNAYREFICDVDKTTGNYEYDFVFNGNVMSYPNASYTNCLMRKNGKGTMLFNGRYTAPGALYVNDGALIFGRSNLWQTSADLVLDGGGIGVAAGVTNSFPALKVASGGKIVLKKGAQLNFAESKDVVWGGNDPIEIISEGGELEPHALRFGTYKGALSASQRRRLRFNGQPVDVLWDGFVTSAPVGLIFHIR